MPATPSRLRSGLLAALVTAGAAVPALAQTHAIAEPAPSPSGPRATVECAVEDASKQPTAPGLRVYVDPRTGELTSVPPPRSAGSGLRVIESGAQPPTGDVPRRIHVLPGVGLGVYVGDLFVHSMRAVPVREAPTAAASPPECGPLEPVAPHRVPAAPYPVAVQ